MHTARFAHSRLAAYHVILEALVRGDAVARALPRGYAKLADQLRRALLGAFSQFAEGAPREGADAMRTRLLRIIVAPCATGRIPFRAFFSSDPTLSVEMVLETYAGRWGIEVFFRDAKQNLGFADSQATTESAVLRTAPLIGLRRSSDCSTHRWSSGLPTASTATRSPRLRSAPGIDTSAVSPSPTSSGPLSASSREATFLIRAAIPMTCSKRRRYVHAPRDPSSTPLLEGETRV